MWAMLTPGADGGGRGQEAAHFIGMPEGNTALAQAALYLATAPKSNAVYMAYPLPPTPTLRPLIQCRYTFVTPHKADETARLQ